MDDYIEVPYQQLSEQALQGLIEEYINREGTDYGEHEYSLADKTDQLKLALRQGRVVIAFDAVSESCSLLSKE